MRTKVTLLLFILVAGLGTLAYYVWKGDIGDRVKETQIAVIGPDAIDLDYLKIEFREPASTVVLEKQPAGTWDLTEPVHWPANFFAVSRLLSQLQYLARENSFAIASLGQRGQSLADYGLDATGGKLDGRLTYGRRGARSALLIGHTTDSGNNLYVMKEGGDRVLVVKKTLRDSLALPLEKLRSAAIFTVPLFEIRSWNLQFAETGNLRVSVFLTRDGDKWRLETPVQARADKPAVETLLNRLLHLEIRSFEREGTVDRNLLGLANPNYRITIESSGRPQVLLVGSAVPDTAEPNCYYAAREEKGEIAGTVFTAKLDFLDELRNSQLGLRDRRVVDFDPLNLQSLTISAVGRPPVTLQKLETGNWQVVSSGLLTMPGDRERINALVTEIAELRAVSDGGFVTDVPSDKDLEDYGLRGAPCQIVITERTGTGPGDVRKQTLLLGNADEKDRNRLYAKLEEAKFVYRVDRALADDLSARPHDYRSRALQQLPEGARFTSLTLTNLFTKQVAFSAMLAAPDQTWEQALAAEPEERRKAVPALIAQLRNLRARTIVAPEFSTTIPNETDPRPWTWQLEGVIALEGGAGQENRPFGLFIDAYTGGTELYVGSSEFKLVFTAEQAFIDAFAPLVFKRADPGPPPPGTDKPGDTHPPPAANPPAPTPAPGPKPER